MKYFLSIAVVLLLTICSCKQENNSPTQEQNNKQEQVEIPEDFIAFYDNFHSDSIYQMAHIKFPLQGMTTDSLQNMQPIKIKWQADAWLIHRPFDDMGGTYKRDIFNMSGIIIESIKSYNNEYGMERRFTKQGGEWMLIYYASMMQL